MSTRRLNGFWLAFVSSSVLLATSGLSRADSWYVYEASLGSLPQSQGWTLFQDDSSYPAPTVNGGILHQYPYAASRYQMWYQESVPLDFSSNSYVYEVSLHLISSSYNNFGSAQRSGYYINAIDQVGHSFIVGLSSSGITINTDENSNPSNGVPFTPFNTTDAFHLYRLTIDQGVGSLFIDGTLFGSTPVKPTFGVDPVVFNRVSFGDGSGVGVSESELQFARFGSAVPEPLSIATMSLGFLGLVIVGMCRRKVSALIP